MKLLIRNLARTTTEASLRTLLEESATLQSCNLVLDQVTNKSKGFAFVEIPKAGEAKLVISKFNNSELDGNKIRVKKAQDKEHESSKNNE